MATSTAARRTIVIADGNLRLAVLLGELLEEECELCVLGTCADAPGAVALVQQHRPDLALVAERLGTTSGTALCRVLRLLSPETALVLRCDAVVPGSPAPALADAVVAGDATFRRLARVLHDATIRAQRAGADVGLTAIASPAPEPPVRGAAAPSPRRMRMGCSDCGVELGLDLSDMAAAVEQARGFFLDHDGCRTSLDLLAEQRDDGGRLSSR